jgi:hypothetical protein
VNKLDSTRLDSVHEWLPARAARADSIFHAADASELLGAFTRAARDAGTALLTEAERARLDGVQPGAGRCARTRDEAARLAILLTAAARLGSDAVHGFVRSCYRGGDSRERVAVLRGLLLLPNPEGFLPIAQDACRTHVLPLFEAIACENPYPARCFSDDAFNQLALKAVFVGLALARIDGLDGRRSPELARMARAFASERVAAGRPIPTDLHLLTAGSHP